MAADQAQFEQLLVSLLSTDNDVRQQAEEAFNKLPHEMKLTHLLGNIHNGQQSEEAREMAAVLLHSLFTSFDFLEFYKEIPNESQNQLLQQILLAAQLDVSPQLRRMICEVVAEAARNLIDEDGTNQWPDILQFLFQCANSPNPQLQESALRIFSSVPSIFGNQEALYFHMIKQMLAKSLDPSSDAEVRVQAVRAVGAFILHHGKEKKSSLYEHFVEMLPQMIVITWETIEAQDDQTVFNILIDMLENCPKFLRPHLELIFGICMKVFSSQNFEDSWRHLVLEVMLALAEKAPAMVRKRAEKYFSALIPLVLQMMTDLNEDKDWSTADVVDNDYNDTNVIAEFSLDRLAISLGGKTVLPHVMNALPAMLGHADWKHRSAALMAISVIGEGCHKQMEAILGQVISGVLIYLRDPHPRVRYAACNAIGQMSTDFAATFEKKFHDQVIPGLLSLLDDVNNPRVQAHAAAALVNFSEDCPKIILTRYWDAIMTKLENILNSKFKEFVEKGNKLVLEQVVTTIGSVAVTCEAEFVVYYDRLMPCLKFILQNANSEEFRLLRGKTIEGISLFALAVGREKFIGDAGEIMDMLLNTHTKGDLPDDNTPTAYIITAWARICKVLGKKFEQYLPLVMGPVMRTASMKPKVVMIDNEEVEDIEGDVNWSIINIGEQENFAIRTAGMDDKACACEMLVYYARELKEGFAEYSEEVVRRMVPMLNFYIHDGVRKAAAKSLPYLLDCAKFKGPQYLEGMWLYICPKLLKVIDDQPEVAAVQSEMLTSLAECIETLGPNCLNEDSMMQVREIINKYLLKHFEKADKRYAARQDEDYDDVVEEELAKQDDTDANILSKIVGITHALFKTNKAQFLPAFDQIAPHFVKLLDPSRPTADRQLGFRAFDDLIEFCGPACAPYQKYFLPALLQYVLDKSPKVRQAVAYGCGVLGQFGGEQFAVTCATIIPLLAQVINDPKSREVENINATEKAISAFSKILNYNKSALSNVDELIALWFSWLPIYEDSQAAIPIYGYLCDLIEANHPVILGANNCNLQRILSITAEAFSTNVLVAKTPSATRMLTIVRQICKKRKKKN